MRSDPINTLSIGGATFDLFIRTTQSLIHACNNEPSGFLLPLGSKIGVDDVIGTSGGGASNTSVGLSRLGMNAAFSGVIGSDQWGDMIRTNMEEQEVNLQYATYIEHEPSNFSLIMVAENGERTILTHKHMDRHFHDVTFDREAAANVDAVFLNHIHEDSAEIEDDIVDILVNSEEVHLTWNPGGKQIKAGLQGTQTTLLASHTDLLIVNKEEALAFTQTSTVDDALRKLIDVGVRVACITDGKNGSVATDGKQLVTCPALDATIVDSTGAGDAFGTGMTWAILRGKDLPFALKAGTINAISVVGAIGAQSGLLTETQMNQRLTDTRLDVDVKPF